jgi:hypothetical protein
MNGRWRDDPPPPPRLKTQPGNAVSIADGSSRSSRRCRGRVFHLSCHHPATAASASSRSRSTIAADRARYDSRRGDTDEYWSASKCGRASSSAFQRAAAAILRRAQYAQASAGTGEPPITGHIPLPKGARARAHDSGKLAGASWLKGCPTRPLLKTNPKDC